MEGKGKGWRVFSRVLYIKPAIMSYIHRRTNEFFFFYLSNCSALLCSDP